MVYEAVFDDLLQRRVRPGGCWQWRAFILTTIASNMAWRFFPTFTLLRGKYYCRLKSFQRIGYNFEQIVRIGTPGAIEAKDIFNVPSSCYQVNLTYYEEILEREITTYGLASAKRYIDYKALSDHLKWLINSKDPGTMKRRLIMLPKAAIPCKEGMMYNEKFTPSIGSVTMEFDLVCEKEFWKLYVKVFDILATSLGFVVGSVLSDRHGRKKVAMIFGSASFVFAVAVAVSVSVEVFIVFRAFAGFLMAVTHVSTDVYMSEVTDRRFRNIFIILQSIYYYVIVASFYTLGAYLCQDWRFLQLLVALPAATSAMFGWFIEESPRWLLCKGKNHEAREIIEKAILMNSGAHRLEKIVDTEKIPDGFIDLFKYHEIERQSRHRLCCRMSPCCVESKHKVHYLFCHKTLLARLVVCLVAAYCIMFCHSIQEYQSQNVFNLDSYSSYFYIHLTAMPFALAWFLAYHYFDRRKPFIVLAIFTSLLFCVEGLVVLFTNKSKDPNNVSLSDLFKTMLSVNQFLLFGSVVTLTEMMNLRVIELFPTEVRNSAYGLTKAFACMGMVTGLLIKEYNYVPAGYMPFCYAGSAFFVAVMIFLTPSKEDGAFLLDTIEQLDHTFLENKEDHLQATKRTKYKTGVRKRNARCKKTGTEEDEEASEVSQLV